jgi:signal peptidase
VRASSFLWGATSVALLGGALVLGVVCLVIPKLLGAIPLTILSGSMAPSMPAGALAVVGPTDATQARVGDVLTYQPEPDDPMLVTHRVIAVSTNAQGEVSLTLQGDANSAPDEQPVRPEQVRGAVVYAVPYVGRAANGLAVGAGAGSARWAAYALIAVGTLRFLLGLATTIDPRCPARRRRRSPSASPDQVLVNQAHDDRALTDGGCHALHRAAAHVPDREDAFAGRR